METYTLNLLLNVSGHKREILDSHQHPIGSIQRCYENGFQRFYEWYPNEARGTFIYLKVDDRDGKQVVEVKPSLRLRNVFGRQKFTITYTNGEGEQEDIELKDTSMIAYFTLSFSYNGKDYQVCPGKDSNSIKVTCGYQTVAEMDSNTEVINSKYTIKSFDPSLDVYLLAAILFIYNSSF